MAVLSAEIRGVVFDLDGVLIHSAPCHRAAFEQVFQQFEIFDFDYAPYAGWRTPEVIEDVLRRHGHTPIPAAEIAAAAREKSRLARQMLEHSLLLAPDAARVLAELASGWSLALASSASRASVDIFLKQTGSLSLFRSVLSGDEVRHAKPHPEIYVRSAKQLGLDPSECLVVEDAVAGVQAARAAGAKVIGVTGEAAAEALSQAGSDGEIADLRELIGLLAPRRARIDPSCWTAIIPAAGRGSRLDFHGPKILYPVAGRLILDHLLDFLAPHCSRLVFVLSPEGAPEVARELNRRIPGRFEVAVQEIPTGMGDAVAAAVPQVRTPHVAVVWGDQVALRPASVESCLRLHQGPLQPGVTCPTVARPHPYIHFERDDAGHLTAVRQAREGDPMPPAGESDTGLFCFRTALLRRLLERMRDQGEGVGRGTGEFNLLPAIPLAAREGLVLTPRLMQMEETIGVNSSDDAAAVADFLRRADGRRN